MATLANIKDSDGMPYDEISSGSALFVKTTFVIRSSEKVIQYFGNL